MSIVPHELTPARQLYPRIRINEEAGLAVESRSGRCRLRVRGSQLSDEQAILLKDILLQLPSVMTQVSHLRATQFRALMVRTFSKSPAVVEQYRNEARQRASWQSAVLETLPYVLIEEAWERCEGTPWDPIDDLLWIAHRGRRYFPAQQFTAAGSPDPAWPILVTKAREIANCQEWELMAWLVTPHPLLKGDVPMTAILNDPKGVISLAGLTLKESRR